MREVVEQEAIKVVEQKGYKKLNIDLLKPEEP